MMTNRTKFSKISSLLPTPNSNGSHPLQRSERLSGEVVWRIWLLLQETRWACRLSNWHNWAPGCRPMTRGRGGPLGLTILEPVGRLGSFGVMGSSDPLESRLLALGLLAPRLVVLVCAVRCHSLTRHKASTWEWSRGYSAKPISSSETLLTQQLT